MADGTPREQAYATAVLATGFSTLSLLSIVLFRSSFLTIDWRDANTTGQSVLSLYEFCNYEDGQLKTCFPLNPYKDTIYEIGGGALSAKIAISGCLTAVVQMMGPITLALIWFGFVVTYHSRFGTKLLWPSVCMFLPVVSAIASIVVVGVYSFGIQKQAEAVVGFNVKEHHPWGVVMIIFPFAFLFMADLYLWKAYIIERHSMGREGEPAIRLV